MCAVQIWGNLPIRWKMKPIKKQWQLRSVDANDWLMHVADSFWEDLVGFYSADWFSGWITGGSVSHGKCMDYFLKTAEKLSAGKQAEGKFHSTPNICDDCDLWTLTGNICVWRKETISICAGYLKSSLCLKSEEVYGGNLHQLLWDFKSAWQSPFSAFLSTHLFLCPIFAADHSHGLLPFHHWTDG